jgi:hypothetical protein
MVDCNATLPRQKEAMKVGSIYSLKGCIGRAKIVRRSKGDNFWWAVISWPGNKADGQEYPFSGEGRYLGSVSWALPDLILNEIIEIEEVEL